MYVVYMHTTPSGKVYVGITSQTPSRRWRKGDGYVGNDYFIRAIKKYGWDNIKHEILFDSLTKEEACQKEIELISKFQSNNPQYGYNVTRGGEYPEMSESTRHKLSESRKGHTPWNKGVRMSPETYEKVKSTMFKKGGVSPMTGKKMSEETKRKMSLAKKGKKCKKICQYDLSGEFLREWNSIKEASEALSIPTSNIIVCCQGKTKYTHGFIFRYLT